MWFRRSAIFVVDKDLRFCVSKRSMAKDACPGWLDLAFGGIVAANEINEVDLSAKREAEAKERVVEAEFQAKLMDNLSINEKEAEALIRGGFLTFDDVAYAEDEKLSSAMEIDAARAEELRSLDNFSQKIQEISLL